MYRNILSNYMFESMGIGYVCPGSSIFTDLCVPGHDLPCKCLCIHSLTDEIKPILSFSVHK